MKKKKTKKKKKKLQEGFHVCELSFLPHSEDLLNLGVSSNEKSRNEGECADERPQYQFSNPHSFINHPQFAVHWHCARTYTYTKISHL